MTDCDCPDVVVEAHVTGPALDRWPSQKLRGYGDTREEALSAIRERAANQPDLFGTEDPTEITIEQSERIA